MIQGIIWTLVVIIVVVLLCSKGIFYIVHQQEMTIIERLGKFHRIAGPGFRMKIPLIDQRPHACRCAP